jgi:hypothetical protein
MMNTNSELLQLATQANRIASRVSLESDESRRLAGRLARDPCDLDALARTTVQLAKEGGIFASCLEDGPGLLLLQFAIAHVSDLCWEDLWNDAHHDRFGQAWDGEDIELMPVWREKVRTIIKECQQEWTLVSDVDDYVGRLVDAGADEGTVEALVDWVSDVRVSSWEDT